MSQSMSARRACFFALLLPTLVWTETAGEAAANTCEADDFDCVSFMQLSRKVTHAETRTKAEDVPQQFVGPPGNNPAISSGSAQQETFIYVNNFTTSPNPTTAAIDYSTTAALYVVPNLMYPVVTVPPGQVKVSIYMDQATMTTTTTTTTMTMRIQIIINNHGGGNGAAPPAPPAPPPGNGKEEATTPKQSGAGNSGAAPPPPPPSGSSPQEALQNSLENKEKIFNGGGPGSSGYDDLERYIAGQAGAMGSYSDTMQSASQSMGSIVPPAPPPPYLSPISVNEDAARRLSGKKQLLETTTVAPNELVEPLKKTELSAKEKDKRAKATLDCMLSQWGPWSSCDTMSKDIVSSMQATRERQIIQMQQPGGLACGVLTESRVCNN